MLIKKYSLYISFLFEFWIHFDNGYKIDIFVILFIYILGTVSYCLIFEGSTF